MTIKLMLDEQQAIRLLRKSMQRKPEIATLLMQGMAKETAVNVLLSAQKELNDLLAVSHAFSVAAGELVKLDKPKEKTDASL